MSAQSTVAPSNSKIACKHLVLDAGPLLSLAPLRGMAQTYYTDKRAREHFERLGLSAGVRIEMKGPETASVAHVTQWAKKTGDYSVLSHADLCVLALTYELDKAEKERAGKEQDSLADGKKDNGPTVNVEVKEEIANDALENTDEEAADESQDPLEGADGAALECSEDITSEAEEPPPSSSDGEGEQGDLGEREPLDVDLHPVEDEAPQPTNTSPPDPTPAASSDSAAPKAAQDDTSIYDDPSDEDDGEGEWITSSNVALHKSRALDLLPSAANGRKGKKQPETIPVGCMTADFAMQNVLLQMGLGLVGVEGKRIERVKSWVLRCHACFKICKDASRKFCPSCGNATLLRASVTISSPNAGPNTPAMQVHLKKNFQFKTRGTIYSIPAPKAGSAKAGPGEGLILREDQAGWQRAKKHADGKREREEKRMLNAASRSAEMGNGGQVMGSWMDPDWVPEILSVGTGGKGRSTRTRGFDGDMPVIGFGRKNPNERKKRQ
ncbi:Nin one binding Zn-ribbon like-domain-containing protein [Fomes fomentarius]|nr:Nin one binding Zn-ribbon like-domain-containing protein [Fomes fomentarius]